jgi:hypothetical protein
MLYRLWILMTLPVAIAAGALKAYGWPATGCGQLATNLHGPLLLQGTYVAAATAAWLSVPT